MASRLRLNTTIKLRWFAVAGPNRHRAFRLLWLPFPASAGPVPRGYWALRSVEHRADTGLSRPQHLPARHAALLLGFDIPQLAALIFLTGGLENPFAFLLVVPVAVSASTQPLTVTVALTALDIALTTVLAKLHFPLPWAHHPAPALPLLYIAGIWTALVSCIAFIAFYSWRMGRRRAKCPRR